jgi:hypothetical protein
MRLDTVRLLMMRFTDDDQAIEVQIVAHNPRSQELLVRFDFVPARTLVRRTGCEPHEDHMSVNHNTCHVHSEM